MKKIAVVVTPEGRTTVHTVGFSGSSCRDASRFIEETLGQRTGEKLTAEFYQSESVRQTNQERA